MFRHSQFAAFAVSGAVVGLLSATAHAHCVVTYRLTSDVTLGSLILTSDYSAAGGEFTGEFGAVACTNLTNTQAIFNDNENAELLGLSYFAFDGLDGPTDLAECEFEPNAANPVAADFVSEIETAGAPNGQPVSGVEVIVSNVSCEGSGSTTTTTLPDAGNCGDPDANGLTATDALFILASAIGLQTCSTCVCDVDGSGGVAASDALRTLQAAVGTPVELACPPCV